MHKQFHHQTTAYKLQHNIIVIAYICIKFSGHHRWYTKTN